MAKDGTLSMQGRRFAWTLARNARGVIARSGPLGGLRLIRHARPRSQRHDLLEVRGTSRSQGSSIRSVERPQLIWLAGLRGVLGARHEVKYRYECGNLRFDIVSANARTSPGMAGVIVAVGVA